LCGHIRESSPRCIVQLRSGQTTSRRLEVGRDRAILP
jgi:hypothetical protein